jgi:hypothetical protein
MAACRYLVVLKLRDREDWVRRLKFDAYSASHFK